MAVVPVDAGTDVDLLAEAEQDGVRSAFQQAEAKLREGDLENALLLSRKIPGPLHRDLMLEETAATAGVTGGFSIAEAAAREVLNPLRRSVCLASLFQHLLERGHEDSAEILLESIQDSHLQYRCLTLLADHYHRSGRMEKARTLAREASALAETDGDRAALAVLQADLVSLDDALSTLLSIRGSGHFLIAAPSVAARLAALGRKEDLQKLAAAVKTPAGRCLVQLAVAAGLHETRQTERLRSCLKAIPRLLAAVPAGEERLRLTMLGIWIARRGGLSAETATLLQRAESELEDLGGGTRAVELAEVLTRLRSDGQERKGTVAPEPPRRLK